MISDAAAHAQAPPNRAVAQWAWAVSRILWAPFDFGGAALAVLAAYWLAPHVKDPALGPRLATGILIHATVFVLFHYSAGFYDRNVFLRPSRLVIRSVLIAASAVILTLAFFYITYFETIGRWVTAIMFLCSAAASAVPRYLLWIVIRRRRRRVLFLGDSALVQATVGQLEERFSTLYEVVAPAQTRVGAHGLPWLTGDSPQALINACRRLGVDEIVLPTDAGPLDHTLASAMRCAAMGCQIRTSADFYEDLFHRVPLSEITLAWLFAFGWDSTNHFQAALKRVTDIALAAVVLLVTAPIWIVVPMLIKIFDNGAVFYVQTRVGHHGKLFRILKFRTMPVDAENGMVTWATENDPRRTGVGRLLRTLRIDELPQLLNILRGDMSFVGPRPERPEITARLEEDVPYYAFRHLVRPGLTGWAQVNFRYGASVEDARVKLEYDLFYVRHSSLSRDLAIVARTVTSFARGAH